MSVLVGTILFLSFIGFQLPLLCSVLKTKKIDALCQSTLEKARRLQNNGGAIRTTFYKCASEL
jgi:hypothetical protein